MSLKNLCLGRLVVRLCRWIRLEEVFFFLHNVEKKVVKNSLKLIFVVFTLCSRSARFHSVIHGWLVLPSYSTQEYTGKRCPLSACLWNTVDLRRHIQGNGFWSQWCECNETDYREAFMWEWECMTGLRSLTQPNPAQSPTSLTLAR